VRLAARDYSTGEVGAGRVVGAA
jgi:hypothetical protein